MILKVFNENGHDENRQIQGNLENHISNIKGDFVKIGEFILVLIFLISHVKMRKCLDDVIRGSHNLYVIQV